MNNQEKIKLIEKELKDTCFKVYDVMNINHKPHPFTIGSRHIVEAQKYGGILGDEVIKKVGCSVKNCSLSYEEHTSDNVCVLQLIEDTNIDNINIVLKILVDKIGESLVDGFTFIESKYKILKNE